VDRLAHGGEQLVHGLASAGLETTDIHEARRLIRAWLDVSRPYMAA
jgi:hypothetical protein